ncbi:hypothetical protein HKX48_000286, partial [Thoreauomyces humboldtii]
MTVVEPAGDLERPTPIVLLSTEPPWSWTQAVAQRLANAGYSSTCASLAVSLEPDVAGDERMVDALLDIMRRSPWPPILIAHGFHALTVQRYLESNRASAAVLIDPWEKGCPPKPHQKLPVDPLLRKHMLDRDRAGVGFPSSALRAFIDHPPQLEPCSLTGFPMLVVDHRCSTPSKAVADRFECDLEKLDDPSGAHLPPPELAALIE